MPPFAACRIKKDFYGLVPKTGLIALMAIHLKFLEIRLTTAAALAAILFIAYMKIPMAFCGREQKTGYINTTK